jgi:hypothetical protein
MPVSAMTLFLIGASFCAVAVKLASDSTMPTASVMKIRLFIFLSFTIQSQPFEQVHPVRDIVKKIREVYQRVFFLVRDGGFVAAKVGIF